jgi:hypothetical protein
MTDLEAIADCYYCHLLEGQTELVAREAAMDLYPEWHPDATNAEHIVNRLIHEASGVGLMWPMKPGWRGGRSW